MGKKAFPGLLGPKLTQFGDPLYKNTYQMMNKNETEDLGGAPESVNSPEAHHSQSTWSGREVLTNSICSERQGNGNSSGK